MPLFLLSMLGVGKSAFSAAFSWLFRQSPATLLCLVLCLALAIDHIALLSAHRHIRKADAQLVKCSQGRAADKAAYAKAQADAAANNKAHVANIEAQQKEITDDVEARYRTDLARLRMSNAASQSAPSDPEISAPGKAPCGPDGKALSLPGPELLQARETELQLNALIDWVSQQTQVDPNEGSRSK
jgi:hypothetical protein